MRHSSCELLFFVFSTVIDKRIAEGKWSLWVLMVSVKYYLRIIDSSDCIRIYAFHSFSWIFNVYSVDSFRWNEHRIRCFFRFSEIILFPHWVWRFFFLLFSFCFNPDKVANTYVRVQRESSIKSSNIYTYWLRWMRNVDVGDNVCRGIGYVHKYSIDYRRLWINES